MGTHAMAPPRSGRFVLRLPPALHGTLRAAARDAGLSLNEYCVRRLAAGGPGLTADESGAAIVTAAAALAGDALVAVAVYGSWVRGDATTTSDVDILVVVEPRFALTRSVYRIWDSAPVTWNGRTVDPHFVHPPRGRIAGGVWGEVAVEGVVLFERDWRLSAELVRIRRSIAAGRLVRRFVHGQPYWTVAA
jgi:hypothetical protein